MEDINKIEHIGQKNEGCATGQHLWDESEGHLGIETDGDLTKIKIKCLACGKQFDISAPLGLNDYIGRQIPQLAPETQRTEVSVHNEQSDILKRILG